MKIERRITFIVGGEGFASWKLNRLKALSGFFRSVVILRNITLGRSVNAEQTLKVISLGSKQNDLCQLWIEGSDAELACMILTDFIADEFTIINTSHSPDAKFDSTIIDTHPAFSLEFDINYRYEKIAQGTELTKSALLFKLTGVVDEKSVDNVYQALLNREAISSTCIGNSIALPHVMLKDIEKPELYVIRLASPTDWQSPRGDVSFLIALLLPAPPEMPVIKAFTQLSRALLEQEFCQILTSTHKESVLKAILLHTMAKAAR
ncbi:PTS sugar transporter subunit IIA [Vibrio hannami]|uniref:PTS sugar transporter subunit IIA n=1 Tax=Vibrio hannami TaxID=2717094 RepID=UPI00240F7BBC|nr:PTS sugar transporter subunit IIA [Vibrio hannami]MDG3085636.1 PTS sugar transporter subunit IIA [Vibrio hannami]